MNDKVETADVVEKPVNPAKMRVFKIGDDYAFGMLDTVPKGATEITDAGEIALAVSDYTMRTGRDPSAIFKRSGMDVSKAVKSGMDKHQSWAKENRARFSAKAKPQTSKKSTA